VIDGRSVLAVITARGGSKGLPRKNIRPLGGKPLLAWSIDAAKRAAYIDRLVLSSEDAEIIAVAREWGCEVPYVRPAELAGDEATSMQVLTHLLGALPEKYDYLALLQPTSPLRRPEDIERALEKCHAAGAPACMSVCEPDKSPYWMYSLDAADRLVPLLPMKERPPRRQQLPKTYVANGAVFIARCDWLLRTGDFLAAETIAYVMPPERSIDVDKLQDLQLIELLIGGAPTPLTTEP
jgi:N-acylneuraminate cytidylyltransferase